MSDPADGSVERLEAIDYWWEGGFPGAFAAVSPHEERVRLAFREVLQRLTDEEFERFTEVRPTLICQPDAHGEVFRCFVPAEPGEVGGYVTVIYLGPVVARLRDAGLRDLVAHEVAHVVLDHRHGGHADEGPADAKAVAWGFRRSYPKRHLSERRAQEERLKEQWNR